MNIIKYIKKYGEYSFEDMPFNNIDNVILSMLSYVNYENIISNNHKNKKTINCAWNEYFNLYSKKDNKKNISEIRSGIKIFYNLKDTKRYSNILMYNYKYIGNDNAQFSAITFEINQDLIYLAFEGTDHLISGWEEDFKMSYMFPVEAQKYAIKYINHNHFPIKSKIMLGGHSKGGNLAITAGMHANMFIKSRILKVYSNDGLGLRKKQFISKKYKNIENKIIEIIPNYSVIGLLLKHKKNHLIIKSTKHGFFSHNPLTWIIDENNFKETELSKFSIILNGGITKWFDSYSDDEIKKFSKSIFDICKKNNINSLIEIKENSKIIFQFIRDARDIDDNTKKMIKELIDIIINIKKS